MLGKALKPEIEEMLENGQYDQLRHELCEDLEPADVAEVLEDFEDDERAALLFRLLPTDLAAEIFENLEFIVQENLIQKLSQERIAAIVNEMAPDDRTELLEELPGEVATRLLKALSPAERRVAAKLLAYPEDSIGRLMTPEYVSVQPDITVERAFQYIRENVESAELVTVIYVVDERGKLMGDLRIGRLLMAEPQSLVEDLLGEHFTHLSVMDDQEEAIAEFKKYDRVALPVTDSRGVLLGIVTVDDVFDVAEEEETEDIQKFGGQDVLEDSYVDTSLLELARKRAGWLLVFTSFSFITVMIMNSFLEGMEKIMLIFVPLVLGTGGNSGTQSAAMVIRALALKEFSLGYWWRILGRELMTGMTMGVFLGGCVFGVSYGMIKYTHTNEGVGTEIVRTAADEAPPVPPEQIATIFRVSIALMLTLICVVTVGSTMGAMLPFFFKGIGFDPAVCSGPFISTFTDISGVILYFSIAKLVL